MSLPKLDPAIPQLPSADLKITAKFFEEKLGFKITNFMPEQGFLSVCRDDSEIHFWKADSEEQARKIGSASSCYIRVKNIKVLFEEFKARQAPFRYELTEQPWGMLEMQIDDPYLNAIRFGQETVSL